MSELKIMNLNIFIFLSILFHLSDLGLEVNMTLYDITQYHISVTSYDYMITRNIEYCKKSWNKIMSYSIFHIY